MDDLSLVRKFMQSFYGFVNISASYYDEANNQLFVKQLHGSILKIYNDDEDYLRRDCVVVEGVETSKTCSIVDYPEKNIVFQGGQNAVCAIEKTFKKVVAKFYVKGNVKKMSITTHRSMLVVYTDSQNFY